MNRFALIAIVSSIAACSREVPHGKTSASGPAPANSNRPVHTQLEVFVELRDPVTGASSVARTHPNVEMLAESPKNSMGGGISVSDTSRRTTLRYVESTVTEDHYVLTIERGSTRKLTAGSSSTSSSSERQVAYAGVAREVWADDVSRIVLQPIPSKTENER